MVVTKAKPYYHNQKDLQAYSRMRKGMAYEHITKRTQQDHQQAVQQAVATTTMSDHTSLLASLNAAIKEVGHDGIG